MDDELIQTCLVFVDDSNLWIEAQKFAASARKGTVTIPKLTGSDHDPRHRIDLGQLLHTIVKGRYLGSSFLYGSRPPPNDSVWLAAQKLGFQVGIFDRSEKSVRGKEKEVDNSMATDLSTKATELKVKAEYDHKLRQDKDNTTFIVITGDRDMRPPILRVLKSGIRVELWAWKSALSKEYAKLDAQNGLLSVHYLDSIFDKISFTNFRSTRKGGRPDAGKTLVLCKFSPNSLDGEDNLESFICDKLLLLGRLFYVTWSKTGMELFVEFPKEGTLEIMIESTRNLFDNFLTVLSWPEYTFRYKIEYPPLFNTSNMYMPLTEENAERIIHTKNRKNCQKAESKAKPPSPAIGGKECSRIEDSKTLDNEDSYENSGWKTVVRHDPARSHRNALRQAQTCPLRIRCKKAGQCGFKHTDEEHKLFRDNPHIDFTKWKTQECRKLHHHSAKNCPFAHSKEGAWCLICNVEGHLTDDCQFGS